MEIKATCPISLSPSVTNTASRGSSIPIVTPNLLTNKKQWQPRSLHLQSIFSMYLETHPPRLRHPHPWEANQVLHTISSTWAPLQKDIKHSIFFFESESNIRFRGLLGLLALNLVFTDKHPSCLYTNLIQDVFLTW